MQTDEYKDIIKVLTKLKIQEAEYFGWLKNNIDSGNFEDVRCVWNTVRFKIEELHKKLRQKLSNVELPDVEFIQTPLHFNNF